MVWLIVVGVDTNGNDSLATGMVQMQNTGIITSCGSIQQRHGRYDISCIEGRGVHFETDYLSQQCVSYIFNRVTCDSVELAVTIRVIFS